MKQRHRKRRIWAAQRAWSAGNVSSGFVPVGCYQRRSPRMVKPLYALEIGRWEGFRIIENQSLRACTPAGASPGRASGPRGRGR